MAEKKQRLEMILGLVDKITGPSEKAQGSIQKMGGVIKETQTKISALDKEAGQLEGFQKMQDRLRAAKEATAKTKAATDALAASYYKQKAAQQATSQELTQARRHLKNYQDAQAAAGGTSAELAAKIAAADLRVQQLNADLLKSRAATVKAKDGYNQMGQKLREQEGNVRKLDAALQREAGALSKAGINTNNLAAATARNQQQMARATAELKRHQSELDKAAKKQEAMTRARARFDEQMRKSAALTVAGAGGMAAGKKAFDYLKNPLDVGMNFKADMSQVYAVSGATDPAQKQAMEDAARKAGATTSYKASDAAKAQYQLGMAGFKQDQIIGSLDGVLNLSKASATGLERTADIASNVMSGYGMTVEQLKGGMDIMALTTTKSAQTLDMLGDAMTDAAPPAKEAGIEFTTLSAMIGKLADAGFKGSRGGNALKSMIGRLSGPPKEAEKALNKLSIATKDASGNLRNMPDILNDLNKATDGMGNADKISTLKKIFGEEYYAQAAVLMSAASDTSEAGLAALEAQLKQAEGASDRIAKEMANNLKGRVQEMESSFESLQITTFELLEPLSKFMAETITTVIRKIEGWAKANPNLARGLMLVVAALSALTMIGGALLISLAALNTVFAASRLASIRLWKAAAWLTKGFTALLWSVVKLVAVFIKGLVVALWSASVAFLRLLPQLAMLAAAFARQLFVVSALAARWAFFTAAMIAWRTVAMVATAAQWAWNAALTANPIGLIIVAIAALVAGLIWCAANWDKVKAAAAACWGAVVAGVQWMGSVVMAAFEAVVGGAVACWDGLLALLSLSPMEAITTAWGGLTGWFGSLWDGIMAKATGAIDAIVQKMRSVAEFLGFDMGPEADATTGGPGTAKKSAPVGQVTPPRPQQTTQITAPATITIHAPQGADAKEIQRLVRAELEANNRKIAQQQRGRLGD
ncbi:phage tail tape measure protein [Aeromonas veronii]|uniref:phage tail tape measure protein n=1 Tax=Aeromonas veronii TaxID=654 RepID=UPI003D230CAB